jgi:hypothetical protein
VPDLAMTSGSMAVTIVGPLEACSRTMPIGFRLWLPA